MQCPMANDWLCAFLFDIDETTGAKLESHQFHHPVHKFPGPLFWRSRGIPPDPKVLESEGVHATFFTPAWSAEHHPDGSPVAARQTRGHEISLSWSSFMRFATPNDKERTPLMRKRKISIPGLPGKRPSGDPGSNGYVAISTCSCGWIAGLFILPTGGLMMVLFFIHSMGKPVPIVENCCQGWHLDDTSYDMYTIQQPGHYYLRSGRKKWWGLDG